MITEFDIDDYSYHFNNFPIDLKVGDEIWINDFEDSIIKGSVYCPYKYDTPNLKDKGLMIVSNIAYGKTINDKIVKMITFK